MAPGKKYESKSESTRQRLEKLRSQLELERYSFESHWKSLGDYILPRRPRFSLTDKNRGDVKNQNIIDSTATFAARTLRSGLMSGVTSPARPWRSLTIDGVNQNEPGPVNTWLYQTTRLMNDWLARTNFYHMAPAYYGDLGVFGTACVYVEEDMDNLMKFEIIPVGRYAIGKDPDGRVNILTRNFMMTARQLLDKFGQGNVSETVMSMMNSGNTEDWLEVVHVVEPNKGYRPELVESRFKRFASFYYERSTQGNPNVPHIPLSEDKFLSRKGYDRFPFFVTRWETNGEDIYGTDCPGMAALGDIKQLQLAEKRVMQAIDKIINPPLLAPPEMRNSPLSILPGDVNYASIRDGQAGVRPVHEVQIRIAEMEQKQEQVRQRIRKSFFEDLFLMLSTSDRREITAREIEERHEEKLWALGPVLEGLNLDFLDPLTDYQFDLMVKQGKIPEPPSELSGKRLKVEYVSVMARAMKMVDLGGMDRFLQSVVGLANADAQILDKIDMDQVADLYGAMTGVPAGVLRSDEDVETLRNERAKMAQQQQKLDAMQQAASIAKDASQADIGGDNLLSQALGG